MCLERAKLCLCVFADGRVGEFLASKGLVDRSAEGVARGEEDEDDVPGFQAGGPATRVMPRHLAVERLAMARRRRNKVSIAPPVPSVEGSADLLSGIMSGQMGLLAPRRPTPPRVDGRYLAPKVT